MARFGTLLPVLMIFVFCCWHPAQAQSPPYLLLGPPPAPPGHHRVPPASDRYQTDRAIVLPSRGYAYGWFGAAPRQHGTVHYGYYRNYIQWSSR